MGPLRTHGYTMKNINLIVLMFPLMKVIYIHHLALAHCDNFWSSENKIDDIGVAHVTINNGTY